MPLNGELVILLEHMIFLYEQQGIDTSSLKRSKKRILDFLSKEKNFNRKKSLPFCYVDNTLKFMVKTKEFDTVVDNPKLSNFIEKVVIDRFLKIML